MASTYLNWQGPQGRETVDQLDPGTFNTRAAFRAELRRLLGEYAMAGINAYASSRMCANWRA